MTMLSSVTEVESRVRNHVISLAAGKLFAFDMIEAVDASSTQAGDLFEQNEDFWLFEVVISDVKRAGPGYNSPRRYYCTLDLALFTKKPRNKVVFGAELEAVADWFQDQTIDGIRFRSFLPTQDVQIHGFTSYNGVINFDFEIHLTR